MGQWKQFYQSSNNWYRRHLKRAWFCLGGLAIYDVIVGAFVWFYCHSSHPMYPDPRATFTIIALIAITVLVFVLWPLACFRFRRIE